MTQVRYQYDLMGNCTYMEKASDDGTIALWCKYKYNESNQLVAEEYYDGKKTTSLSYEYDADGNRISKTGKIGTDKVQLTYEYTVENRLAAVYDADELLVAMAYDGDGNRVFQLNYNLHTDDDWKGNSGNGNGNNKDNKGSGNSSSGSSDSSEDSDSSSDSSNSSSDTESDSSSSNNGNNGNGNKKDKSNNGNSGNSSANNGKGGNGKNNGNTKKNSSTNTESTESESAETENATDSTTETAVTEDTTDSSTGNGNATNAEENNSQNQCGILFPVDSEVSHTEQSLIDKIKTTGKQKNYELIEYINDVNREYTEVLVEQNINGKLDTAYIYGNDRLSLDRFDGSNGYYLYDPRGSVTGITNEEGQLYQSYRYDAFGNVTFGAPQYENEYTYNGESYNPNIESQYLRARYYDVVNGNFLTEDSYLGDINEPLTINRYNYCVSSPLNYVDPSGHIIETVPDAISAGASFAELIKNPSWENALWFLTDIASIFLAGVPGSYVPKGAMAAADVVSAASKMDNAVDAAKTIDTIATVAKHGDNLLEVAGTTSDIWNSAQTLENIADGKKLLTNGNTYLDKQANEDLLEYTKSRLCDLDNGVDNLGGTTPDFYAGPNGIATSLDEYDSFIENASKTDVTTGLGYDAGDTPVRIDGEWSINDMKQGLLGHPPKGLGSPDIHHGGQMPGGALHEVLPGQHRINPALHPNTYNQGVTPEMRMEDRQLHWWYRAREQGADELLPDWIYD